ncbi:acyltransferase [Chitinophaga sp.]|uniref:acyltransferase family protein n=1 Tax=Chitinophaga sp. TaxID=1869181 RepID=UPI0031E19C40
MLSTSSAKPHYEVLDGLRGTAAITIVVFHFLELVWSDYSQNPLGHGFLAVDFFFCLSGFVIGYAYDGRLTQIGYRGFFRGRLLRLHPLVPLGSVLGLLSFLFDPFGGDPYAQGVWPIVAGFLCSLLLIPFPWLPGRGGALFPFNSPTWSLFMEYCINVVYALVLNRLHKGVTLLLTVLAAGWLAVTARHAGTLIGGWADANIMDGFARVSFSFLAGLSVYRFQWILRTPLGFVALSLLLLATFMCPYFGQNWLTEWLIVAAVYPLVIALGAGATATGWWLQCCRFIGRLSYPLYMTHIFLIWPFGNYYAQYKPGPLLLTMIVAVGTMVLMAIAYLAMRWYDEPVRRWLNGRLKSKTAQSLAGGRLTEAPTRQL